MNIHILKVKGKFSYILKVNDPLELMVKYIIFRTTRPYHTI